MARVFAVASAKGGVGKTTTTANVGAMLAGTGADVVVVDGDIGMANLGAALGIDAPANTLHDVLSGTATPSAATYEGPDGVYVVPGETALSAYAEADPGELQSIINVHSQAEYVLIDVGAGISHETSLPLSLADEVLLVSTPERDALQDTEKTRQLTNQLGGTVTGAVITRAEQSTPVSEMVTGTLGTEILATIPEDAAVPDALAVGEPLTDYAPRSPAAEGYRDLVAALTDREPERPPEPASTAGTDPAAGSGDSAGDEAVEDDAAAGDEAVEDDAAAGDEAVTISESANDETASPTAADNSGTATDTNEPAASDSTSSSAGGRPPDDIESKWAEAATGSGVDGESDDAEQTTESIAEATEPDSDPASAPASADDEVSTPESDSDDATAATGSVEEDVESDDGESESAPAGDAAPGEEAASDTASEADDGAGGDPVGAPTGGDDTTTGDDAEAVTMGGDTASSGEDGDTTEGGSTESSHPESGITPEPANAPTTDDSDEEPQEDGIKIPESEPGSERAGVTDAADSSGSVDDDAIPFRDEDDASDEVVDPVEPQPTDSAEAGTQTNDSSTAEEPVIPDAEGDNSGSAVPTELMGGPDEEDPDDDEDDESKGFLRRLLFG